MAHFFARLLKVRTQSTPLVYIRIIIQIMSLISWNSTLELPLPYLLPSFSSLLPSSCNQNSIAILQQAQI